MCQRQYSRLSDLWATRGGDGGERGCIVFMHSSDSHLFFPSLLASSPTDHDRASSQAMISPTYLS